jgi:hypothetical protein
MLATTIHNSNTTPHHQRQGDNTHRVLSQDPTVCRRFCRSNDRMLLSHPTAHPLQATGSFTAHTPTIGVSFVVLLRKEVIQPHLPVRLPCYDFVPIADPTFDHSLPLRGWAMGFGCYRLS